MPVSEDADGDAVAGIVGSISEKGLLDRAFRDPTVVERTVGEVMDRPLPLVDAVGDARRGVRAASAAARRPLVAIRGERAGRRRHEARPARVPVPPRGRPGVARRLTPRLGQGRWTGRSAFSSRPRTSSPPARRVWMNAAPTNHSGQPT